MHVLTTPLCLEHNSHPQPLCPSQFLPQVAIGVMVGMGAKEGDYSDRTMKAWTQHLQKAGALTDKNEKGGISSQARAHYAFPTLEEQDEAGLYPRSRYSRSESGYLKNSGCASGGTLLSKYNFLARRVDVRLHVLGKKNGMGGKAWLFYFHLKSLSHHIK